MGTWWWSNGCRSTLFSDKAMWVQHGEYSWKCSWPVSRVWPTIEMAESMHRCHRADLPLNLFRSCMSSTHGPMLWRANAPDFCLSTWWFTPVGKWVIPPVIAGNPAKNWGYTSYTSHLLTRLNHEVCTFPLTKPKGKPKPCGNHQLQPLPRVRWDRRKTSWGFHGDLGEDIFVQQTQQTIYLERIGPSIPWLPIKWWIIVVPCKPSINRPMTTELHLSGKNRSIGLAFS